MSRADSHQVPIVQICKRVGVVVVEPGDSNASAFDTVGICRFVLIRWLDLTDLKQDFITRRLNNLSSEFSGETPEFFRRNTEVFRLEWRGTFKNLELVAKPKLLRLGIEVTRTNLERFTAFDLQ